MWCLNARTGLLMGPVFLSLVVTGSGQTAVSFEVSLPSGSEWAVVGIKPKQGGGAIGACRLVDPAGRVVQDKGGEQEHSGDLSDQQSDQKRGFDGVRFFIQRPQGGLWRMECEGDVEGASPLVHWAPVPPRLTFLSPEWDAGGDAVDIVVEVDDPDSMPDVVLYRDDDDQGFDGEPLTKAMRPIEGRVAWRWNLKQAPKGVHHLYAVAYDGADTIVRRYAPGRVFAGVAADLAVAADYLRGDTDQYVLRLRVDNLGPDTARNVVMTWEWPEGVVIPMARIKDWGTQEEDKAEVMWTELPAGTHQEVLWPFEPKSPGPWPFVVRVEGSLWDPTSLNNAVELVYDRNRAVFDQLDFSRSYVPDRIPAGSLLEYQVRVVNPGEDPAENLVIYEQIPDEAVLVDVETNRGVIQNEDDRIRLSIQRLQPKEEAVLAVTLSVVGKGEMSLMSILSHDDRGQENMVYLKKKLEIAPR